jgi:hypothetical protein
MVEMLAALVALGCLAFVVLGVWVGQEAKYQGRLAEDLRRDLGFEHATPIILTGRLRWEVLAIGSLTPDGAFERAGFRVGDVIIGPSIGGLYKMLHHGRGSEVRLTVVDGGDGPRLSQRSQREITVRVPGPSDRQ